MWKFITPQLPVSDVAATQAWYRDVLDFEISFTWRDGFGGVISEGTEIFLSKADPPHPLCVCCVRVEDADALYAIYRERGAKIVSDIEDQPWGVREFTLEDPNGHRFRIGHATR